ncbi:sacsin N-terminal ATP-binding-like domain-containing protein [Paludisphaera soli]|uniref:sacsin N-terminal ATP-binding-like domain-containing protein n=1 Tax=Paludisphaera soli TaxID=2712865 RepID=UPI0013EBC7D6|nr:hypothetical protein [Paludisphaera soli]
MGYEQSIESQINQLRDVLQRYHGFAVVRELLQNADDAGATRLDIGWVRDLGGAQHELLGGGPAVFILNDGEFTASNARSIAQLGLSDKAGEHGRIGKFGLGLKSIHHLGEVYFYLSSSTFEGERYKPNDVQNPWTARKEPVESFRPEWDGFAESDQSLIREKLEPVLAAVREDSGSLTSSSHWFCLWVPLRRKRHVGDDHSAIIPEYPGDEASPHPAIFPGDFEVEVARLLPFLKHIVEVRCWVETHEGILQPISGLRIEPHSRRASIESCGGPDQKPLTGRVRLDRFQDPRPLTVSFTGFEALVDDHRFAEISARDDWPRPLTLPSSEASRGRSIARPEPAVAHAAACLVSTPSEGPSGRLDIVWASYLPVKLPEIPSQVLSSPYHLTLTLHGRFFVDAGRGEVDFGDGKAAEERSLRQRWNDLLRDEGTLDLVIPAMESFADSLAPEDRAGVMRDLTSAIHASTLFSENRRSICRRHQWAYRHGPSGAAWTDVGVGSTACEIPEPAEDEPSLEAVFPSLAGLCDDGFCAIYGGWPDLMREERRAAWPEPALLRLLELDAAAVFADPRRLSLFVRTVEVARGGNSSPTVAARLREIARQGMSSLKLSGVMRQKDLIQRYLALIPAESKLKLDLGSAPLDLVGPLVEALWEERCSVLATPIAHGAGCPTREEEEGLLARLLAVTSSGREGDFFEWRVQIACQVVGLAQPDSGSPRDGLADIPIFPVRAGTDGEACLVGRGALAGALRAKRLFADVEMLGGPLLGALRDGTEERFIIVARRIADAAFGRDVVPSCDPLSCLRLLESAPLLVQAEARRGALLGALLAALGKGDVRSERQPLRYLLHATPDRCSEDAPLYHESDAGLAPIWASLASRALQQSGGGWRVVPRGLADLLNTEQKVSLDVRPLDRPGVVDLLRSTEPAALDLADLAEDDLRALIEECKAADFEVIRALPIHLTNEGLRVSIDDRCRWRADFPIDGDLADNVIVLEPDRRPAVALKQREIHPHSLDAKGIIDLILKAPDPQRRWRTVLDALSAIGEVPSHLSNSLKTTRWITTRAGRPVSPHQVVNSRSMNDVIRMTLADLKVDEPEVVSALELPEPFLTNRVVHGLYPSLGDALERLGRVLAHDERYRVGPLGRDEVSLAELRSVFADAPAGVMPCFPLLRGQTGVGAIRENQDATIESRLVPALLQDVSGARTEEILAYLAKRHAEAPQMERGMFFSWYRRYLDAACKADQIEAILADIPLLSQAEGWERASTLTTAAVGVDPSCLLHPDLARILAEHAHRPGDPDAVSLAPDGATAWSGGPGSLDEDVQRGAVALGSYAEEWASLPSVPRELIGGLMALLGDAPALTDLARNFLGSFQAEALRENLAWDGSQPFVIRGTRCGGAGISITQAMRLRRTIVELADGDRIRVSNLLGRPIEVDVRQTFDDLLLPHDYLGNHDGLRYFRIRIRRVNPARLLEGLDPVSVLRETARRLLEVVDRQTISNFHEVWGKLAQGEQLDLAMAQLGLQEDLPTVLQNLGLRNREPIATVLRDWHEAKRELAQLESTEEKRRAKAEDRKRIARDKLRRLLETDVEAQGHCLNAVREKIKTSQYTLDSIPFELFQNADDSVAELRVLLGDVRPPDDSSLRFVVDTNGRALWFASWGRAINRHQAAGFHDPVRGFDQDLEKMLALGWSDKGQLGHGDDQTTGKFGLGFKSVLLATDRPRVLSDRLAFEVVGGLFPRALGESRGALQERIRELGPARQDGTIVELSMDGVEVGEVLERFRKSAPLLAVFGREIRSCIIRSEEGRTEAYRWEPVPIDGTPGAEVGELPGLVPGRLLVLRGRSSATALAIGREGVEGMPHDWPTIWVTAPTRQAERLGFAVNAPFDLDVGRSQLAYSSSRNEEIAAAAGREVGDVLVALHRQGKDGWEGFARALGLNEGASPLSFWVTVWERLGKPLAGHHDPHGPLLRGMFWGAADRGMRRLVSECDALPNGLWGDDRDLTGLGRLRARVSGLLDSEDVYNGVACWPRFRDAHPRGSLVSGRVYDDLKALASGMPPDCVKVTLGAAIVGELGPDQRADAGIAARMGALISPEFLGALSTRGAVATQEIDALKKVLADVRFQTRDRDWHHAADLVMPGDDDEGLRAAFAPPRSVLSDGYVGEAAGFFRACRGQLRADARILKGWAMQPLDEGTRRAVLTYLIRGQLAQALSDQLIGQLAGGWLARLDTATIMGQGFDHNQAAVILGRLGITPRPTAVPTGANDRDKRPAPRAALASIHDWWGSTRAEWVSRYERQWYPAGSIPKLSGEINRRSPVEDRGGWMIMLMLGAMHTMGRTRAEAHRDFLVLCKDKGWLDVFSRPTDDLGQWMEVLKEYLDQKVGDSPYLHWMGRFVSIFQLAHWLHDYVETFLAIDRVREEFELDAITASRTSPIFQGGGLGPPPVSRTLGIGACFVVRELVRAKIITNPLAHRHCYVPSARVRRLVSLLGCPGLDGDFTSTAERVRVSGMIYEYLVHTLRGEERALFQGDFDLPLIALTEPANRGVLADLLGSSQADELDEAEDELQEVF